LPRNHKAAAWHCAGLLGSMCVSFPLYISSEAGKKREVQALSPLRLPSVAIIWLLQCCPLLQVDIEDEDDAERALTLSNPVLESLERWGRVCLCVEGKGRAPGCTLALLSQKVGGR